VTSFSAHTEEIDGVAAVVGQFSSLGFPRGYSSSGDVFVYYLRNEDPSGHVRLTFDDWNLSPYSSVTVIVAECSMLTFLLRQFKCYIKYYLLSITFCEVCFVDLCICKLVVICYRCKQNTPSEPTLVLWRTLPGIGVARILSGGCTFSCPKS